MHPRILIVSQNWDYTNPTRFLLHRELANRYGAILSGWNYSENPNDVKFRNGAVDVVIADPWAFTTTVSHHYTNITPGDIRIYGVPVFLNLLSYDLHNLSREFFSEIVSKADYVLSACSSPQFHCADYSYGLAHEQWLDPNSAVLNDPGLIDDRFILIPHAISPMEFNNRPIVGRPYDVSVLGVSYAFRREAQSYISKLSDVSSVSRMGKLQSLLGRLSNHYIFGPRLGFTHLYRSRFRRFLSKSKVSVTCDGSIGYPIRKFFEIPANGAVLAASFFPNSRQLGFVHDENCFSIDRNRMEELGEIVREARSGSARMDAVAKAGREMIMDYHTVERRAAQIVDVVTGALSMKRMTTSWNEGALKLAEHVTN